MTTREKIRRNEEQIRILQKENEKLKKGAFDNIYLDDYLESIEDFDNKLAQTLTSYNIDTVEQLVATPRNSMLAVPSIGPAKLKFIESWIKKHGVYLRC